MATGFLDCCVLEDTIISLEVCRARLAQKQPAPPAFSLSLFQLLPVPIPQLVGYTSPERRLRAQRTGVVNAEFDGGTVRIALVQQLPDVRLIPGALRAAKLVDGVLFTS
jgi:hypothetical protein